MIDDSLTPTLSLMGEGAEFVRLSAHAAPAASPICLAASSAQSPPTSCRYSRIPTTSGRPRSACPELVPKHGPTGGLFRIPTRPALQQPAGYLRHRTRENRTST